MTIDRALISIKTAQNLAESGVLGRIALCGQLR